MARFNRRTFFSTAGAVAASAAPRTKGPSIRIVEDVPVIEEADVCVLGGSCTGAFAAIRAARLGARVVLIEKQGHFGGVAAVTCTWHSLHDTEHSRHIIAGLTAEITTRMKKRGGVRQIQNNASVGFHFSPGELKLALDEMVIEAGVRPHLHTLFSAPVVERGKLTAVVVDGKSGRGAIRAKYFVDATGDGDLCARLGLSQYSYEALLPPTTCAFLANWQSMAGLNLGAAIREHGKQSGVEEGFVWGALIPETDVYMLAGTRVNDVNCAAAPDLTRAEIEGRRQVGAILDLVRHHYPERKVALHDFPATIGIRDTRHIRCRHQLTGEDVLSGRRFPDAIANGSYRVDVHHQDKPGITLKYLDGTEVYARSGHPEVRGRWRANSDNNPTFYQVPLRSLIPGTYDNLILAGRMLDADKTAFSAVRVMVNTNQMGEAAGVAAYTALDEGIGIPAVKPARVREVLARGGSVVL